MGGMNGSGMHWRTMATSATAVLLLGCGVLIQVEWLRLREVFDTQSRIVHRLLSQQMVQHEAVLATLSLLPPSPQAARQLTAVYPHVVRVEAVPPGDATGTPAQSEPTLHVAPQWATGRYRLGLNGLQSQVTLDIDLKRWRHPPEWPDTTDDLPLSVLLRHRADGFALQSMPHPTLGWPLRAEKAVASASQPFVVTTEAYLTWVHIPWTRLAAWALLVVAGAAAWLAWQRQQAERRRSQALLKLGQVSRLGTLAEVGAGVAHEINQPLTAVLATAQAARRLLADSPPDIGLLRQALDQTVEQARRAADVVTRLRRLLERPSDPQPTRRVSLADSVNHVLDLLAPTLQRLAVTPRVNDAEAPQVLADPVALEQIVHNLVQNALQALEAVPAAERQLQLTLTRTPSHGVLTVVDSGSGIAPELLPRLFEPFVTTRPEGLGLGLTLSETLASHMGGRLRADHHLPRGALFELMLPLAPT